MLAAGRAIDEPWAGSATSRRTTAGSTRSSCGDAADRRRHRRRQRLPQRVRPLREGRGRAGRRSSRPASCSAGRAPPGTRPAATSTTGCSARSRPDLGARPGRRQADEAAAAEIARIDPLLVLPTARKPPEHHADGRRRAGRRHVGVEPVAGSAPPVAAADEPVAGDRGERRRRATVGGRRGARSRAGRRPRWRRPAGRPRSPGRWPRGRAPASPRAAMSASGRPPASYSARISASARHAAGAAGSPASRRRCAGRPCRRPDRGASAQTSSPRAQRAAWWSRRVLVEVGVGGRAGRPASRRRRSPGSRAEDLGEVEVDRAHGPVEVDLLVHEAARGQEHLEGADRPGSYRVRPRRR